MGGPPQREDAPKTFKQPNGSGGTFESEGKNLGCLQTKVHSLGLQIVQRRSYLHILGPNVGTSYILGALGILSFSPLPPPTLSPLPAPVLPLPPPAPPPTSAYCCSSSHDYYYSYDSSYHPSASSSSCA